MGSAKRPVFEYFDKWDEGFAWWTTVQSHAERFMPGDKANAKTHVRELRKHPPLADALPYLVRVMGFR
jgi:hypothetical protein